ncbi:MAG: hypothetical protein ACRCVV_08710 [Shewanella sp.]
MAMFLISIIALQFVGANFGAHQLHAANGHEELDNHPHLQFRTQVTVYNECVDCVCPNTQSVDRLLLAEYFTQNPSSSSQPSVDELQVAQPKGFHSHQVKITEIQDVDLCLDCQCHGGHVALLTQVVSQPLLAGESVYIAAQLGYLPPDDLPHERPPIV